MEALDHPTLVARVRPPRWREPADAAALSCTESGGVFVHPTGRQFQCDHLLRGDQEEVWEHVGEPLVAAALRGHSATVLAVGPTGGGRTYTLHGTADEPGLAPRALRALFAAAAEDESLSVELCMLEVYMGHAFDVLVPRDHEHARVPLTISTGPHGSTAWWSSADANAADEAAGYLAKGEGASMGASSSSTAASDCWHAVSSWEQAEALRQLGEAQRSVRPTALHPRAARAHSLLYVRLTKRQSEAIRDGERGGGDEGDEGGGGGGGGGVGGGGGGGGVIAYKVNGTIYGQHSGGDEDDDEDDEDDEDEDDDEAEEDDESPGDFEWQCRLCFGCLGGGERVDAHGSLSIPSLREGLALGSSLSAVAGAVPLLARREAHRVAWGAPNTALLQLLRETLEGRAGEMATDGHRWPLMAIDGH
jgi:hypothetical protein